MRWEVTARQIWGSVRKMFSSTHRWNMPFLRYKPLHEMKSEIRPYLRKIAEVQKVQMPPRRSVGGRKLYRTRKPPIGGTWPKKEQRNAAPLLPRRAAGAQRQIRSRSPRLQSSKAPHQKSEGYPARTAFTHQKAEPFGRHSLCKASCRKQSRQPSEGCSGRFFRNRRRVAAKLRKS